MDTKISVIMPVYNTKEEYLREAIESILNQTYPNFEFIIIDDGSTNNAKDIIKEYQDKDLRIKLINGNHKGVAAALNQCIEIAQGEYIARMDADDISFPKRFEKQINYLENHPEISILSCSPETFPKKGIIELPEKVTLFDMLRSCPMCHPAIMMKRQDLIKFNLKYNESYIVAQDYELWSRAIKYLKMANMQTPLIKYRIHEDNNVKKNASTVLENDIKIKKTLLNYITHDLKIQNKIMDLVFKNKPIKLSFFETIFSVKNERRGDGKWKLITFLGIRYKFKVNKI